MYPGVALSVGPSQRRQPQISLMALSLRNKENLEDLFIIWGMAELITAFSASNNESSFEARECLCVCAKERDERARA